MKVAEGLLGRRSEPLLQQGIIRPGGSGGHDELKHAPGRKRIDRASRPEVDAEGALVRAVPQIALQAMEEIPPVGSLQLAVLRTLAKGPGVEDLALGDLQSAGEQGQHLVLTRDDFPANLKDFKLR